MRSGAAGRKAAGTDVDCAAEGVEQDGTWSATARGMRHAASGCRGVGGGASARRFEVLDTVDFGGAAGAAKIQGRAGLSRGVEDSVPMGRLLFQRRGQALLKDDGKKKRWNEDKAAPPPASDDAGAASLRLSRILEDKQPSMAVTIARAATVARGQVETRSYRRARGRVPQQPE
uniref:Uncharacterized protein n=1 Tax=Hemiselmis tepida TaxID=464990 RepID=A0A7S0VN87_9CRYP|mmetsp:Transcript_21494/g.54179  ORF Transcript_21494/g.54179 Transcript_21494/m.54179 type:complete len:174 (+) Transcript_21494:302-823(+)